MAIIKDFETPQGVVANYHKLRSASIDIDSGTIMLSVAVYATAESRVAGRKFLWMEYQAVPFTALTQDPRDLLYPLLANYGSSFLKGGVPDATGEGFARPGDNSIALTAAAMTVPTPTSP